MNPFGENRFLFLKWISKIQKLLDGARGSPERFVISCDPPFLFFFCTLTPPEPRSFLAPAKSRAAWWSHVRSVPSAFESHKVFSAHVANHPACFKSLLVRWGLFRVLRFRLTIGWNSLLLLDFIFNSSSSPFFFFLPGHFFLKMSQKPPSVDSSGADKWPPNKVALRDFFFAPSK